MPKSTSKTLPRAVIMDMDGVLVDSEPFICRAACLMFAEKGLAVKARDFLPFVGTGEDRFLGGVAEKYGFPFQLEEDKARTYRLYLEIIRGELKPMPGVTRFIAACRAMGKKLGLASSADRVKVAGNLKEIGLPEAVFDTVVTGNDVLRKKPDPAIFLLAARNIGCRPEEALVVEDAPNGVQAAREMGARCLAVTSSFSRRELVSVGAAWCVKNLARVPPEALAWK